MKYLLFDETSEEIELFDSIEDMREFCIEFGVCCMESEQYYYEIPDEGLNLTLDVLSKLKGPHLIDVFEVLGIENSIEAIEDLF